MEIEYNLIPEDIEAFARFHVRHGPKLKPQLRVRFVGVVLGVMAVVSAGVALFFSTQPGGAWITGCCAGAIVGALITLTVLAALAKSSVVSTTMRLYNSKESRWFFAWKRLRISAEGFEYTNEFQQVRQTWDTVWMIDSTDDHLFFYTTLHQAHTIPRRAFRDGQHFEEFIDLACRYHKGQVPREAGSAGILDALPAQPTGITDQPRS